MNNVPLQVILIHKIIKTKGDQEDMILPDSDQEDQCPTPNTNKENGDNESRLRLKMKQLRFSNQNQVYYFSQNGRSSPNQSPALSPKYSPNSLQSILKPKSCSIFGQAKR
ncbi:unnamed protein product (macronuclear) [Paramecium tetraurelia]|uniref:Uncharacterized protein n=1 Tax=Paramecium tetraurelia TaxID=5888 RepID=A0DXM9_PARTE|nr:uncharacterized protein GSPATT00021420001 [Paramecium tetraurelia]CAK87796.1 unnamed protein product [Paramecium tetraurelia]|eukprot:XP_001455193.1 hypothetical protein (macronuclear) [Paramecium tetraurelia strain d4-2]